VVVVVVVVVVVKNTIIWPNGQLMVFFCRREEE
jgi:hypothetical protein